MKKTLLKSMTVVFSLLLLATMLCSCSGDKSVSLPAGEVKSLVVEVDGKTFTIENMENKTIKQLLDYAKITLNEGDAISLDENANFSEDTLKIRILRQATVTVKDSINNAQYTIVLAGGTVADAISAAGIKLADNHTANYDLEKSLEDNMKIVVSVKEEPSTTEPYEEETEDDSDDGSNDNSDSGYIPPAPPVTKAPTTNAPAPSVTKAPTTNAPTTKPAAPTTSGRTVVSVEIYEDCDGSGHGVKVITYSDGTQEEVEF